MTEMLLVNVMMLTCVFLSDVLYKILNSYLLSNAPIKSAVDNVTVFFVVVVVFFFSID